MSGKDANGADASITEADVESVHGAKLTFYNAAVTDVNGYETVEHGRIKWQCWDDKCEGNMCAQEHSGETRVTVNECDHIHVRL